MKRYRWKGEAGADLGVLAASLLHQLGVDVDRAHVVDDGAEPQAVRVGEEVLQQRGLPCSEEAREDSHRDWLLRDCLSAVGDGFIAGSDADRWPVPAHEWRLTRHAQRGRGGDEKREREVDQLEWHPARPPRGRRRCGLPPDELAPSAVLPL